uniref:Uncharacterized protein n=1 Tax=Fagus sylvatica TaxID=28930 RepID=A0A2N9FNS0_FAGSY
MQKPISSPLNQTKNFPLPTILPTRLEDAGLEDSALPPDSIQEAYLRAATAVKSRASSIFPTDDDEGAPHGPCATEKGSRVPEVGSNDVVVRGGKACVEGLQGLEIGDRRESEEWW